MTNTTKSFILGYGRNGDYLIKADVTLEENNDDSWVYITCFIGEATMKTMDDIRIKRVNHVYWMDNWNLRDIGVALGLCTSDDRMTYDLKEKIKDAYASREDLHLEELFDMKYFPESATKIDNRVLFYKDYSCGDYFGHVMKKTGFCLIKDYIEILKHLYDYYSDCGKKLPKLWNTKIKEMFENLPTEEAQIDTMKKGLEAYKASRLL